MKRQALCIALVTALAQLPFGTVQAADKVMLQVEDREVGLNDAFQVRIELEEEVTEKPELRVSPGLRVLGQSVGPFHSMVSINGQVTVRNGTIVTWTVRANALGKQHLGPVLLKTKSGTQVSSAATIEVTKVSRPADPFSRALRGLNMFPDQDEEEAVEAPDPALALSESHPTDFFVHARADKTKAYVGEQVSVTYDIYLSEHLADPDLFDLKESTCDQCLVYDHTEQRGTKLGIGLVGGRRFVVKRVRKAAFFPLALGKVMISPLSLSGGPRRVKRESERVEVDVIEPPKAGRPGGYTLGDTGRFELECERSAATIEAGGTVVVTAKLSGAGNFPSRLTLPHTKGLNFLEPDTREALGPDGQGLRAGTKTFTYAVRTETPGNADLGNLQWSYFDPAKESYRTLSCALGRIQVTGASVSSTEPTLALLPAIRTIEPETPPQPVPGAVRMLALGLPLLAGALALAPRPGKKKTSTKSAVREHMKAARGAREAKAAAKHLILALDAHVHERYEVELRGLPRHEAELLLPSEAHAYLETRAALEAFGYDPSITLEDLRTRVEGHLR